METSMHICWHLCIDASRCGGVYAYLYGYADAHEDGHADEDEDEDDGEDAGYVLLLTRY